jgi:hypothetical protein
MLDLETVQAPILDGLDIVSLDSMKKHLRINNNAQNEEIQDAVREAGATLSGLLNRTVFLTTFVRHLHSFPRNRIIQLPYPPLVNVLSIAYLDVDGASPSPAVSLNDVIVRRGDNGVGVASIELVRGKSWPRTADHQRAVSVYFEAGYADEYPPNLKRLLKILAADFIENKEASINDRMQSLVSRKTEYGVDFLVNDLRIPVAYDDWE